MEPSSVALFAGASGIMREAGRLMAEAATSIAVTGYPMRSQATDFGILDGVRVAMTRGVDVRLYIPSSETSNPLAVELVKAVGAKRIVYYDEAELPKMGFLTTDHAVLFVFAASDPSRGASDKVVGVRIRGSPLPQFTRKAVKDLLHPMRATPLGPSNPDGHAAYVDALAGATKEIQVMAGSGWSLLRTEDQASQLKDLYQKMQARGVKSRFLLDNDAVELVFMHDSNFHMTLDEIRVGRWIPALAAIIDEREVFLAAGEPASGVFFHSSRDLPEVQWYLHIFELLWQKAKPLPRRRTQATASSPRDAPPG